MKLLNDILYEDEERGLSIKGEHLIPAVAIAQRRIPLLRNYMVDDSIQGIIINNLRWAQGKAGKPKFKFAYVMLPTPCNLRCVGCFTGQDKGRLPDKLDGPMYGPKIIDGITRFLKEHDAEAVVYGGGGELFTQEWAFDYIDQITGSGLGMVVFTNGTLLSKQDIRRLSSKDISLIFSTRDVNERDHNLAVRANAFRKTLQAVEYAMEEGMHTQNQLAIEIPVTRKNERRVLYDFIPAMRYIGLIPLAEEFILRMCSPHEISEGHNFSETKEFFKKAVEVDRKFGFNFEPVFGQRMLAQPKCERPLYSFTVFPSGSVTPCPADCREYGNFNGTEHGHFDIGSSLKKIICSHRFKKGLVNFQYCPCSTFFTENNGDIPKNLLPYLKGKCQK